VLKDGKHDPMDEQSRSRSPIAPGFSADNTLLPSSTSRPCLSSLREHSRLDPPPHSSHSFTLRLLGFWKDEAHLFLELSTWTSVLCIAHFQQIILSTLMNSGIWPVPQQTQSSLSVCAVLVSCAIKTRQKVTANNEDTTNTYCLIFSCLKSRHAKITSRWLPKLWISARLNMGSTLHCHRS
jgi:hypothetical protein